MTKATRPGPPTEEPRASLSLLDWRRRVAALYATIRSLPPPDGHAMWVSARDRLFSSHDQSPLPTARRRGFDGLPVWPYDPGLRFEATVQPVAEESAVALPHSADGVTRGRAVGTISLPLDSEVRLTLFRLDQYGDHLFLPFVDGTAGGETYRGGRYLVDTAKGADLGSTERGLVIDFNFAYHPSCVHASLWSCPLAPPSNRFDHPIRAGEHLGTH